MTEERDTQGWIVFAADFLLRHLRQDGRVEILDSQYPESHLYLAGDLFPILAAFQMTGQGRYIEAAVRILDYFRDRQSSDGAWTLGYLEVGGEQKETVMGYGSFAEIADQLSPFTSSWVLTSVRKYEILTGDMRYRPVVERAIDYLSQVWVEGRGFDSGPFRTVYGDALLALALSHWQHTYPAAGRLRAGATRFLTQSPMCWSQQEQTWFQDVGGTSVEGISVPAVVSCVLLETTGKQFVESHILPAVQRVMSKREYRCSHDPGLFSYWPYRSDRADVRANAYVLLLTRLLDRIVGTDYCASADYAALHRWLASMRDEDGFLEYENCSDGRRGGHSSAAQIVTSFYAAGTYRWDAS